jgi:hypothetical protein
MRSLARRFEKFSKENPYWADHTCFAMAVYKRYFSKDTIRRHFNKLINKNDYVRKEKRTILKYLYALSRGTQDLPEEDWFKG